MEKIETSLENLTNDIGNFYKINEHHFMVMNAVDLGDKMELQWFFCNYAHPCDITMFSTTTDAAVQIPSIASIVASAWVAEAELVDLMGIDIENAQKGFVLDADSRVKPLRKKK